MAAKQVFCCHFLCILALLQVYDGYFVHYFAPRGLPVVPKDVIFVIDVSGSMIGTKIKQVKWTPFSKLHGALMANGFLVTKLLNIPFC